MPRPDPAFRGIAALSALLLALAGCAPAILGAGVATTVSVAQERPAEEAVEDSATKVLIEDALFQEQFDNLFRNVGVIVVEGRVLLTGTVPSPEDAALAGRLAADTEGVQEVLNELVAGEPPGTVVVDTRISLEIRAKLVGADDVRQINYWTTTENRVVHLIGIAQDEDELARALDIARNIAGVEKVVNHVILKTDPRRVAERN